MNKNIVFKKQQVGLCVQMLVVLLLLFHCGDIPPDPYTSFTVTFKDGQTTLLKKTVFLHETTLEDIPFLEDSDEIFAGWYYTNTEGLWVEFDSFTPVKSDMVVHAKRGCVDVDGNAYRTVKIGNQRWLAENYKSTHYNDGKEIPFYKDSISWLSDTTGLASYDDSCTEYGLLYNWYAVSNDSLFAPPGWHVPTQAEFDSLIAASIRMGYNYNAPINSNSIAKALAGKSGWFNGGDTICKPGTPGNNQNANNDSRFDAVPQGIRNDTGQTKQYRQFAWYWSKTTVSDKPSNAAIFQIQNKLDSVRLLKND